MKISKCAEAAEANSLRSKYQQMPKLARQCWCHYHPGKAGTPSLAEMFFFEHVEMSYRIDSIDSRPFPESTGCDFFQAFHASCCFVPFHLLLRFTFLLTEVLYYLPYFLVLARLLKEEAGFFQRPV